MRSEDFKKPIPGELVQITTLSGDPGIAFVPHILPPDLSQDNEIAAAAERSALALGNLNGAGRLLPNPALIYRPFMQREALASSRIEGTQAEFDQLVLFEAADGDDASEPDIQEVRNYLAALRSGWAKPPERAYSPGLLMEHTDNFLMVLAEKTCLQACCVIHKSTLVGEKSRSRRHVSFPHLLSSFAI